MNEWAQEDELTEDDLEFLEVWENMGKDSGTDSLYQPEQDDLPEAAREEGDLISEGDSDSDSNQEGGQDGELSGGSTDREEGGDSGESDRVDESKMDLSEVESDQPEGESQSEGDSEPDHLEGGEAPDEIPEGEDDLEFDPMTEDDPNYPEAPDSEADSEDPDDDFDKGGEETHYDQDQVEEDDGEGERADSDEQRESDAPIEHNSDEAEADDEPDSESEKVDNDLDAQKELEDHLRDNQKEGDEQQEGEEDSDQKPDTEGKFEGMPSPDHKCDNHCEDNPQKEEGEPCEHCNERIKRERELWGVIGYDMDGKEILPGDKLKVVVPISFMRQGAVLTANVPNTEVDPVRQAESTAGDVDDSLCWLSGFAISQFTGWHMQNNGPIWTFKQGAKIPFVEKIGEPKIDQMHGDNLTEGDDLDVEDLVENLKKELDQHGHDKQDEAEDDEQPEVEEQPDEEEAEEERQEGESEERRKERHREEGLTNNQHDRFDNLTERIIKKVGETFGNTAENVEIGEALHTKNASRRIVIKSRGVEYQIIFGARREEK
jgi:hypothetical protein